MPLQLGPSSASYYRARYYDSSVGRFMSEDPSAFTDGIDFYVYVRNNPVLYFDPTGLTTYVGFSGEDLLDMILAVERVEQTLKGKNCGGQSCAGPDAGKLLNALEGATFVFNPKSTDCGSVGPSDWVRHRIVIGPTAFGIGCCYKGSPLNALPSTLLHETFHLLHIFPKEGGAFELEKNCFGCQRAPGQR